jgi:hypothetical protein
MGLDQIVPGHDQMVIYNDEESIKKVVHFLAETIEKHGMDILAEMTEPATNERFHKEDHLYFYENHQKIAEDYMERERISPGISLEATAKIVFDKIKTLQSRPFMEAKNDLMGLGAFYSYQLGKAYKTQWGYDDKYNAELMQYNCGDKSETFTPIGTMMWCWKCKEDSEIAKTINRYWKP